MQKTAFRLLHELWLIAFQKLASTGTSNLPGKMPNMALIANPQGVKLQTS
ncbi:MAG: hypothetical protein KKH12_07175 [Gammaproteobacteria bacterium]|nr:hypothetical protein [Gammaproteobacteria bacterium]MBU1481442.1 hypothetical protein [Gammaproteobacteria bacterium]